MTEMNQIQFDFAKLQEEKNEKKTNPEAKSKYRC